MEVLIWFIGFAIGFVVTTIGYSAGFLDARRDGSMYVVEEDGAVHVMLDLNEPPQVLAQKWKVTFSVRSGL